MAAQRPYSEQTAEVVDEEARRLANDSLERTIKLLTEKKDLVKAVAERLMEREVIQREDVIELLGERPFKDAGDHALSEALQGSAAAMAVAGPHDVDRELSR
jgi:AFG3 family protein